MRRIILPTILLALAVFFAAPAHAEFDAAAFRKHFVAGLAKRPNTPPLTPENVQVEAVEKAATFGGMDIFVVKGQLAPQQGQAQPFIMFVSADGQFYVSDIVDMSVGKSILKDSRERMRATELKNMGHTILKGAGSTVVTYVSDPFCPYCRTGYAYLLNKKAAFSELRLAHFPLSSHPGADIACALMVWAADKAPAKLADFTHFAYTDLPQPKVESMTPENLKKAWAEVAGSFLARFPELKALGKDGEAIVAALRNGKYTQAVAADMAKATSLDISGTPVIFVGAARVDGFSEQKLDALLK